MKKIAQELGVSLKTNRYCIESDRRRLNHSLLLPAIEKI